MDPSPLAAGLREYQDSRYDSLFEEDEDSSQNFSQAMSKAASGIEWNERNTHLFGESRYEILALLEEGTFGHAFLAKREDSQLFRVTIPFSDKLTSRQHVDQFEDECKIAQTLNHSSIQTPIEFGEWDETRHYYSVNYLGLEPSLATLSKAVFGIEKIGLDCTYSIIKQTIEALAHAHKKEIWHRNLTPANIWILKQEEDISILIGEFGFSFDSRYQFGLLEAAEKVNTFMAPECINNDASYIDQRADIYSVGRIIKLLMKISESPDLATGERIQKIVYKATEPRRSERFQSIVALDKAWQDAIKPS